MDGSIELNRLTIVRLLPAQVVVVEGETGSGKTTQIPQFLVDAGYTKVRARKGQASKASFRAWHSI